MKIKTIEIHNYKAFYGDKNVIDVDGKNLFIYGENGSGKSSLYYALKDFFQSSMEAIDLNEVENIFIADADKGKVAVKLTFNPDENDVNNDQLIELSSAVSPFGNTIIRDANQLRSFLNYKHLLDIHNIKKNRDINFFDLLVKGVLKHFKITGMTKPLGETWQDIESLLARQTDSSYNITAKRRDLGNMLNQFNVAFKTLFTPLSPPIHNPDYILSHTNNILKDFDKDLKITLSYNSITLDVKDPDAKKIYGKKVNIEIEYGGKKVSKPHLFLNEARLSAIAISIYLGMIKRLPQLKKMKILFLDDLFIGLDLSNRMPLMCILERDFSDYQIIISTYDKPWYEVAKFYLDGNADWKCVELLARKNQDGYDQPLIKYISDLEKGGHITRYIETAKTYYNKDNKAAGVYLRGAFEFILKRYCKRKGLHVRFEVDSSLLKTEDFWNAIKNYQTKQPSKCKLTLTTIRDVELCRKIVFNPLCHQNQTQYEFSQEIQKAIEVLDHLNEELDPSKKTKST
ncbi:DNA replication and repair protein RecF [termite gut metagenome]|uniref:DNA replication and repair protein RecF n=1 Tax=termite gut metagenome TaxID=433724 RepID=A0A5J4SLQ7_9ZZZZ